MQSRLLQDTRKKCPIYSDKTAVAWAAEMAQWVEVLAAKSNDQSLPELTWLEERNDSTRELWCALSLLRYLGDTGFRVVSARRIPLDTASPPWCLVLSLFSSL